MCPIHFCTDNALDLQSMDKYHKVRAIGMGTGGDCFLVHNKNDGKLYVMKCFKRQHMCPKERAASVNEASVISSLNHPNVVKYVESFLSKKTQNLSIVYVTRQGCVLPT